jgi:hypothetical protein
MKTTPSELIFSLHEPQSSIYHNLADDVVELRGDKEVLLAALEMARHWGEMRKYSLVKSPWKEIDTAITQARKEEI